ncbi:MAG TPA: peroxiredoxin [Sedimentisphaerales bacterium]|jgi:peroxiredoxin Q/BCP|nr:peroxiredoxin [Sedimentisphaerales bacterium]HNU29896.1 peroxiredoxin [Sedimentisphaerales bacterium]
MRRTSPFIVVGLPCLFVGLWVVSGGAREQPPEPGMAVGDKAPQFNANTHAGDLWQTQDHVGRGKYLVVYFYPAAMTGGCTKQACSYRDQAADLGGLDVEVVGVSADSVNSLKLFREAQNLNFTLLSDVNGYIARQFGVPISQGGSFKTTIDGKDVVLKRPYTFARWTFVIGKDGRVLSKDTAVDPSNDSQKALDFLQHLGNAATRS